MEDNKDRPDIHDKPAQDSSLQIPNMGRWFGAQLVSRTVWVVNLIIKIKKNRDIITKWVGKPLKQVSRGKLE